jgi:hypothetical protein
MIDIFDSEGHAFHAQAIALSAQVNTPLKADVEPQGFLTLAPSGGYDATERPPFKLQALISYESAHTQVAGFAATWPCEGWVTLSTAEVRGLNLLDVVTADRVVGQIRTIHPLDGRVPTVSLLGTRFENLRIAGHPVSVELDLDILGKKPANDAPYSRSAAFVSRAIRQYERIAECGKLPPEIDERYNQVPSSFIDGETVECSLVNRVEGPYPGRSFGHLIRIPHFGVLTLGKLEIDESNFDPETRVPKMTTFQLTMLDLQLNCTGDGHIPVSICIANGTGKSVTPPPPPPVR